MEERSEKLSRGDVLEGRERRGTGQAEVYRPPAPFADSFDLLIREVDVSIGEDHAARLTIRVIVCGASF